VAQIEDFADDFLNRAQKVWLDDEYGFEAKFSDLAQEDLNNDRTKRLIAVAGKLEKLSKQAKQLQEQALAMRERFRKVIEEKPAPELKQIAPKGK
jgi:hypothetical protein